MSSSTLKHPSDNKGTSDQMGLRKSDSTRSDTIVDFLDDDMKTSFIFNLHQYEQCDISDKIVHKGNLLYSAATILSEAVKEFREAYDMKYLDQALESWSVSHERLLKIAAGSFDNIIRSLNNIISGESNGTEEEWKTFLSGQFFRSQVDATTSDSPIFMRNLLSVQEGREDPRISAWKGKFVGKMDEYLWDDIRLRYQQRQLKNRYVNLTPYIQSSGTGKSRTIDELAKKQFVIPICLRKGEKGIPPPDFRTRDYLTDSENFGINIMAFLSALFSVTQKYLEGIIDRKGLKVGPDWYTSLAQEFRSFMVEGQSIQKPSRNRKSFYDEVIQLAEELRNDPDISDFEDLMLRNINASGERSDSGIHNKQPHEVNMMLSRIFKSCHALCALLEYGPESMGSQSGSQSTTADDGTLYFSHVSNDSSTRNREKILDSVPLIILAFDESSILMDDNGDENPVFGMLRRRLKFYKNCQIFSVFLSSKGPLTAFVNPPSVPDPSLRIMGSSYTLNPAFTGCTFDAFAIKNKELTMDLVTSEYYMAHLGRPLWATLLDNAPFLWENLMGITITKLLNVPYYSQHSRLDAIHSLACLSQRLPIKFLETTHISDQKKLVENHMRICLRADPNHEHMVTVSSSEPLLSEAAFIVMQNRNFHVEDALISILSGISINKGDRGELIVLLLLLLARDAAVKSLNNAKMWEAFTPLEVDGRLEEWRRFIDVPRFIGKMFKNLNEEFMKGIEKDFSDSFIHLNHFVKGHDQALVARRFLPGLISRGSGLLCADSKSAHAMVGYNKGEGRIEEQSVGFILVRVENDPIYDRPDMSEFDQMDKVVIRGSKDDESYTILPVIRIFFALSAEEPCIETRIKTVTVTVGRMEKSYTAYDIWCSGVSSKDLHAVDLSREGKWRELVYLSRGWMDNYKSDTSQKKPQEYLERMNPGAGSLDTFWDNFYDLK